MSNKELDKYGNEYSKFIDSILELHNRNVTFYLEPHNRSAYIDTKNNIRKTIKILTSMKRIAKLANTEGIHNFKEAKHLKKIEKAYVRRKKRSR